MRQAAAVFDENASIGPGSETTAIAEKMGEKTAEGNKDGMKKFFTELLAIGPAGVEMVGGTLEKVGNVVDKFVGGVKETGRQAVDNLNKSCDKAIDFLGDTNKAIGREVARNAANLALDMGGRWILAPLLSEVVRPAVELTGDLQSELVSKGADVTNGIGELLLVAGRFGQRAIDRGMDAEMSSLKSYQEQNWISLETRKKLEALLDGGERRLSTAMSEVRWGGRDMRDAAKEIRSMLSDMQRRTDELSRGLGKAAVDIKKAPVL